MPRRKAGVPPAEKKPLRSHAPRPGAPSPINAEITKTIVQVLNLGAYIETAAAMAGISKDSLYEWLRRGARERRLRASEGEEPETKVGGPQKLKWLRINERREKEQPYAEFSDALTKAVAQGEVRHVMTINGASQPVTLADGSKIPGQWTAAAWMLERRHPERWGYRGRIDSTVDGEMHAKISIDDIRSIIDGDESEEPAAEQFTGTADDLL